MHAFNAGKGSSQKLIVMEIRADMNEAKLLLIEKIEININRAIYRRDVIVKNENVTAVATDENRRFWLNIQDSQG